MTAQRHRVLALLAAVSAMLFGPGLPSQAEVRKLSFPNGFRLLMKPEPGRGLVAMTVIIRAGALEEQDTPGLGQLMARTLMSGARNLSARKLTQLADDVGGSFSVSWDMDYTEVYVSTTSDQMQAAVELLAETLIHPKFEESAVQDARERVLQELESSRESTFRASYDEVRRLLYTSSPYRRPQLGDESVVRSLTAADLQKFAARWFVPGNMVLSVVGDADPAAVEKSVRLWFGKQPAGPPVSRVRPATEQGRLTQPSLLELDTRQSYVVAGTLASAVGEPGFAADVVAATVLGGGKASRMFQTLREQRGLAYELGSLYPPLIYQSHVVAYVLSSPYVRLPGDSSDRPTLEAVRTGVKEVVESLSSQPITQSELERAKRFITGSYALRHQRLQERSKHLAWYEALGLGFAYDERFPELVNAVTLEQARESARRLFSRSAMVVVVPRE